MFQVSQFRELVVQEVLKPIGLWSQSAENLLIGTMLVESRRFYLKQTGNGPALGLYQMEPTTHNDIWGNYLLFKKNANLCARVRRFTATPDTVPSPMQLVWNLAYATIMCRIHYLRIPEALPQHNDVESLAQYWKTYYNTKKGKGEKRDFIVLYNLHGA